jgi:hypothetical protein
MHNGTVNFLAKRCQKTKTALAARSRQKMGVAPLPSAYFLVA